MTEPEVHSLLEYAVKAKTAVTEMDYLQKARKTIEESSFLSVSSGFTDLLILDVNVNPTLFNAVKEDLVSHLAKEIESKLAELRRIKWPERSTQPEAR